MAGPVVSLPSEKTAAGRARPETASRNPWLVAGAGILVPGAGHALLGHTRRAAIFLGVLTLMTVVGLAFGGRLFPFEMSEPLVFLAAVAEWSELVPRAISGIAGLGQGDVVRATYDYGNTFLISAGLLNLLVMLDAFDRARGARTS